MATKNTSVIDINGSQYNAITGQLLGTAKKLADKAKRSTGIKSLDGFVGSRAQSIHTHQQRTTTLMRSGLKKPEPKIIESQAKIKLASNKLASLVQPDRVKRAQKVNRHQKIMHFGNPSSPKPTVQTDIQTTNITPKVPKQPVRAAAVAKTMPSMVTSVSHHQLERLLDHALLQADAHKQALRGRFPGQSPLYKIMQIPRWLKVVAVLLIVFVAGGLFAWQNMPAFSMKLAATKAHIKASIPAYSPSGFKFAGPIVSNDGIVSMKFTANGDTGRNFIINQRSSSWDSASLLANYLSPTHETYQSSQVKGTTVYIHGVTNDATWVNNGIWYTIKDKANLNSDQLLKIADSL